MPRQAGLCGSARTLGVAITTFLFRGQYFGYDYSHDRSLGLPLPLCSHCATGLDDLGSSCSAVDSLLRRLGPLLCGDPVRSGLRRLLDRTRYGVRPGTTSARPRAYRTSVCNSVAQRNNARSTMGTTGLMVDVWPTQSPISINWRNTMKSFYIKAVAAIGASAFSVTAFAATCCVAGAACCAGMLPCCW